MIVVGKDDADVWHVLTVMDSALLCKQGAVDWDDNSSIVETKEILNLVEGLCTLCVKRCYEIDGFGQKGR